MTLEKLKLNLAAEIDPPSQPEFMRFLRICIANFEAVSAAMYRILELRFPTLTMTKDSSKWAISYRRDLSRHTPSNQREAINEHRRSELNRFPSYWVAPSFYSYLHLVKL